MAISANAQLEFEAGQVLVPMQALTDTGDHKTFASNASPWSACAGFVPEIAPDGVKNGGEVTRASSGADDQVDVAAVLVSLSGVETPVAAETGVTITRGIGTDVCCVTSITVTDLGDIAAVAGTDGTSFTETRGAAGGPPLIPFGSVEIAQVRTTSVTPAPIQAAEILATFGQHCERFDFPSMKALHLDGKVELSHVLPLSHTGGLPKRVYAKVYTPVFQACAKALDFVPIERTFSQTSQEYYGGSAGGQTESLAQGKFTALLDDGHTDSLIKNAGKTLIFRFKQDRNRAPYSLTQGTLGISRTYPKSSQVQAACTISGEQPTKDFPG